MKRWCTLLFSIFFFGSMGPIAIYLGLVCASGLGIRETMSIAIRWSIIGGLLVIPVIAADFYCNSRHETAVSRFTIICTLCSFASLVYALGLVWQYNSILWMMSLTVYASMIMTLCVSSYLACGLAAYLRRHLTPAKVSPKD